MDDVAKEERYFATVGYEILKVEPKYYADGEDAFDMRISLKKSSTATAAGNSNGDAASNSTAKSAETVDTTKAADTATSGVTQVVARLELFHL